MSRRRRSGGRRSTASWWMRPAAIWGSCAAVPKRAGTGHRNGSPRWRNVSGPCWRAPPRCWSPVVAWCTPPAARNVRKRGTWCAIFWRRIRSSVWCPPTAPCRRSCAGKGACGYGRARPCTTVFSPRRWSGWKRTGDRIRRKGLGERGAWPRAALGDTAPGRAVSASDLQLAFDAEHQERSEAARDHGFKVTRVVSACPAATALVAAAEHAADPVVEVRKDVGGFEEEAHGFQRTPLAFQVEVDACVKTLA